MPAATLTSKGQITIPAHVRRHLQVDAGDRVEFVPIAHQAVTNSWPSPAR